MASDSNFDITTHILVPKHRVLSDKEITEVLKKFNISKFQLPQISVNDAVSKLINAKEGDIIEIKRANINNELYLRRVIK